MSDSFNSIQDKFDHDLKFLNEQLEELDNVLQKHKDDPISVSALENLKIKILHLINQIETHPLYNKEDNTNE